MRIVVSCGGTGGHVFPGLAVAEELRRRGHVVAVWLAGKEIEGQAAAGWDGEADVIRPRFSFSGSLPVRLAAMADLGRLVSLCARKMRGAGRPGAMLAMGSYASIGPVLAARLLGIPVVLHESNVIPGRALELLARFARAVAVSHAGTCGRLPGRRCVLTGCPVRAEFVAHAPVRLLPGGCFTLLAMGGSQGAAAINSAVSEAVCLLRGEGRDLQVVHLTGPAEERTVRARYEQAGVPNAVFPFLREMVRAYATADLAVCRAGAVSCAELTAMEVPALLVPYPFAARDHQRFNADAMREAGVADVVAQKDLGAAWLAEYLRSAMSNPARLEGMRSAAGRLATSGAAARLASLIEEAADISPASGSGA